MHAICSFGTLIHTNQSTQYHNSHDHNSTCQHNAWPPALMQLWQTQDFNHTVLLHLITRNVFTLSDHYQILTLPAKWNKEEKELCQYMPEFYDSLERETELFSMLITGGEMWVYGYKQHTCNSHLGGKTPYLHAQERQDKFAQIYGGLNWCKLKVRCPLALTLSLPAHYTTFKRTQHIILCTD